MQKIFTSVFVVAVLAIQSLCFAAPPDQPLEVTSSWWQNRQAAKLKALESNQYDLIFIGDSITQSWSPHAVKPIWNKFYGERKAIELGFSMDRTENALWRVQNSGLEKQNPKLYVVMIGTNNVGRPPVSTPEETAIGIKAILDSIQKISPNAKILLLAIFPRGKDVNDKANAINMQTNKIISKFDDHEKIFFLDINKQLLQGNETVSPEIMADYLHPTHKGLELWAQSIEPAIALLLGEKPVTIKDAK